MGSHESRPRLFETIGALAASIVIAGGASAQETQRPRGRPITQAQMEASLSPTERAEREAYRRRAQTDPEIIALQRRGAEADRQFQATCTALRAKIRSGDRSQLGTELSSACGID